MQGTDEWRPVGWVAVMTIAMGALGSWGFIYEILHHARSTALVASLVLIGGSAWGIRLVRALKSLPGDSQNSPPQQSSSSAASSRNKKSPAQ